MDEQSPKKTSAQIQPLIATGGAPRTSSSRDTKTIIALLSAVVVIFILLGIIIFRLPEGSGSGGWDIFSFVGRDNDGRPVHVTDVTQIEEQAGLVPFESADDFKAYLALAGEIGYGAGVFGGGIAVPTMGVDMMESGVRDSSATIASPTPAPVPGGQAANGGVPGRFSETNVQVKGIDEPDIVKTDGKQIYFSSNIFPYYFEGPRPMMPMFQEEVITDVGVSAGGGSTPSRSIAPSWPPYQNSGTVVVRAFPPADLTRIGKIDEQGELLLHEKTLAVLGAQRITGYDVSAPETPRQTWQHELEPNNSVVEARFFDGKLYLITATYLNRFDPCPIMPMKISGSPITIPCVGTYHPRLLVAVDVTYTILKMDPGTGALEKTLSFVGPSGQAVTYMSPNALYVTYPYAVPIIDFLYLFVEEAGKDLFPKGVRERLAELRAYDIGNDAMMVELSTTFNTYLTSLGADERLRVENEMQNRMSDFLKKHEREFDRTSITKVSLGDLAVSGEGSIPGRLLNQFSIDEHEGFLRAAVTVGGGGGSFWAFGFGGGSAESVNDVYVLDDDLDIAGSIQGLGVTERIYSARFVGDKGYLVTFRETDPFYVLDLSKPRAPSLAGELKIPGYSSYLHPITDDSILGVGKEGGNVKLSLFDVSSAEKPIEAAKYTLNEYWSSILDTHHAFLHDEKHKIFFIPGSQGGYIFSYTNDSLKLLRAVSGVSAERALFIDDFLYLVGNDRIIVLNETDWTEVKKLDLLQR